MSMIKTLLISCILIIGVYGRPSGEQLTEQEFSNLQFTVEKLDAILKAYEHYKQYFPAYVWSAIDNMTSEQKTQFVAMVNDYHAKKYDTPKDFSDLLSILKKSYPSLAEPYESIYNKYQEQLSTLGPKAQAFSKAAEAQMYLDASPDRIVWACHMFNGAKKMITDAKALLLDDAEAEKIETAFPEAVKFMNSKEFEAYAIVVNNLQPLDCEKDREQIFNTIKLMDKQSVITTN